MTDILHRLRDPDVVKRSFPVIGGLVRDAADEIERLRKILSEIAAMPITVDGGIDYESAYDAIIIRARAALAQ